MSTETPVLTPVPLAWLVTHWRPGSRGDDWTWAEEYVELTERPATFEIERRVLAEGIGFMDHIAPILLGDDGRIWDGHHRIVLAMKYGIGWVRVEGSTTSAPAPAPSVAPEAVVEALREALNAYRAEVDRAKASSMSHALLMLAGATLANAVEAAITPKEDR